MATIKDIAKAAGVSVSTVSHVINKTKYVSEELTEKVNQALLVCDTLPNFIQIKMPAQKKNEIIVISSSCSSHYLCLYQKDPRPYSARSFQIHNTGRYQNPGQ